MPPPPSATETVTTTSTAHEVENDPSALKDGVLPVSSFPKPPTFTDKYKEREYLKGRLAAAFRIFGKNGYDEGVAGHITLRDPVDPTTFFVNPFGVAFSHINASDLLHVDHDGNVIDGGRVRLLNTAAYMIHAAVHNARPDVMCAAHSHSIHGRTFCALGRPLDITTQDSCAFYNDHAVYTQFKGVVLAREEGQNIARALGNKKAALLQNHGLLTVGKTIEEAVYWFVTLEKLCYTQLMADAAAAGRGGETIKIPDDDSEFTYKQVGSSKAGYFSAQPMFDIIHRETNGEYLK